MSDAPMPDEQDSKVLIMLILYGLSTFANALQREFPEFQRCNQDELGRRGDVEHAVHAALARGLSVCVDRTNIDASQRRTWIEIAHQYPNVEIWGVQMDTPYETCSERLATRMDHPTIKTPERALEVLSRFAKDLVPIDLSEGFNRVYHIPPHHSPDFTRDELEDILASIRATPFHDAPLPPPPIPMAMPSYPPHSRGFNPHRARGWGHANNQDWRSSPSNSEPHSQGSNSGSGTWMSDRGRGRGGWSSQDGGGRGFGGDNRRPYRGGYGRGRGGWNLASYGNQGSSRGGPPSNRGDRLFPYGRGGRSDGSQVHDVQTTGSVTNADFSMASPAGTAEKSESEGPSFV